MKKKIFGGLAVLGIAAMAAFNIQFGFNTNCKTNYLLSNVEALASGEIVKYQECYVGNTSESAPVLRWCGVCQTTNLYVTGDGMCRIW